MAKIRIHQNLDENGEKWYHDQYMFFCEGCQREHAIGLKHEGGNHTFNMDLDNPTFSPSILCDWIPGEKCHSYIKNGMIQYLGDCYHHLKGKTVQLREFKKE